MESCASDQTSWVTINDVVTQNAGRRLRVESNVGGLHYRCLETTKSWQKVACRIKRRWSPLSWSGARVTIDVAECSTSQWKRPTPQAPDLECGVLPSQQAVVRCRNSVKVEDFLNSFFIHSIFVKTLSDMCVLLSPVRQGAAIQPRG